MRRDLSQLSADGYDVLVVGGGIHGACAAWEAALRGLKVALVEAGDFGHATSSNSLRTLHGGLRHLQRLDFARMRESIRERREWLRLAPQFTAPMRFVLATSGHGLAGPEVLRAALWVNDVIGRDRNDGVSVERQLPGGRFLNKQQAREVLAGIAVEDCNGAASWYDAVCFNTERLQFAVVRAAAACGARVANYVRATSLLIEDSRVCGLSVHDEVSGAEMQLKSRVVINAAGPWVGEWLGVDSQALRRPSFRASKAFNLLTRALPFRDGVGVRSRRQDGACDTYFIIPWNGFSLVGTRHLPCDHSARSPDISRADIESFLADLNSLLGAHRLSMEDVRGVFAGLLPERADRINGSVALERTPRIIDHSISSGVRGLYSIVGVKWTIARAVAERAVVIACAYLRRPPQLAAARRLRDDEERDEREIQALVAQDSTLSAPVVPDLIVSRAQILHAARSEMAVHLDDAVMRRTPLYLSDALSHAVLADCAALLARELRWNGREMAEQIERTRARLDAFRGSERDYASTH